MIRESLELCDNILLVGPARLPTRYGPFRIYAFQCPFTGEDHVARVLGFPADLRTYKCAACVLRVLGVKSIRLMTNNPAKIEQLESYGVRVSSRIPLQVPATAANIRYLRTKKSRLAHLLETPVVNGPRARRGSGRR